LKGKGKGKTRRLPAAAVLTLAAVLAAACGASAPRPAAAGGSPPGSLSLELAWVPNPDHVALYYAQDKGYFARNKVAVKFLTPSSAADPIKLAGLGKVDLAITYETEMFYGEQEHLPVTAVATLVPVPLNSLIVTPKDHVTRLSQMKGRKVGITGVPSDNAFYTTMLRAAGLTRAQVPLVTVGYNLVPSLLAGKVDAIIGGYRNVEAIQIAQELGRKPTVFPASELGVPSYAELVIVANRNRLATSPRYAQLVRRFVAALVEATNAARRDPAGATRIMEQVSQYKISFLQRSVPYTLRLLAPPPGMKTGCIDEPAWRSFGAWMKRSKLIHITPRVTLISTGRYLPYRC
jgi:putative hydroxymethylpyrimidine transport system substrate-binding protein